MAMMNGNPITTYRELYTQLLGMLGSRFEADQLFYHVTQKKSYHLPFVGEKPVPDKLATLLLELGGKRKAGVPLQYLLGEWEFYGLPFKVGRGVLIPRADTEALVDVALDLIGNTPKPLILDLCSGSGCIAVTLSHLLPHAAVTALEISEVALGYLRQNVELNGCAVEIVSGDVYAYTHPEPLHLIVSNPPYIPRHVIGSLQAEVQHEPRRALDGGRDGLSFYRAIAARYLSQLLVGGWICFEVGIGQSEQVAGILRQNGYGGIGVENDANGIPRVVFGRRLE